MVELVIFKMQPILIYIPPPALVGPAELFDITEFRIFNVQPSPVCAGVAATRIAPPTSEVDLLFEIIVLEIV